MAVCNVMILMLLLCCYSLLMNESNAVMNCALFSGFSKTWSAPLARNKAISAGRALPVTPVCG